MLKIRFSILYKEYSFLYPKKGGVRVGHHDFLKSVFHVERCHDEAFLAK